MRGPARNCQGTRRTLGAGANRLQAGLASPARNLMELISDDDRERTTRSAASSEAPAFLRAASTALSADPMATLKNWNVGAVSSAGRHLAPSGWIRGTPGIVSWTTHPEA